jgi:hypothetical protein
MSDVKTKFEEALARRKQQKTEETARKSFAGGGGYPDTPYAPLYTDKQQAFRFIGLPYLVREKPTDSKRVHISMILGDDDKKFRCIGPDPQVQKDWILYRVMNKVLSRHWDKNIPNSNGQLGAYIYDYATTHPELYNRVAKNNNAENNLERGWRFNPYILFNVIDRANYAWHLENKKYRVLSKKASEWQEKVFFEPGVPDTVFQLIMDDIVAIDGNTNWEDYDIVICKVIDKPWYKVYHGVDDVKKLDDDIKALIVKTGISAEERSWELNDFDKLYRVTLYSRIKAKLGLFFQKVDKVFGTKYYDELVALVDKEEFEIAEKQTQSPPPDDEALAWVTDDVAQAPPVISSSVAPVTSTSQASASSPTASSPLVRSTAASTETSTPMTDEIWAGLANGSYNGKTYLGVPGMKSEEMYLVKGIYEDGSFEWLPEAGDILEGSSSHFKAPAIVKIDPLDGTIYT